MQNEEHEPIQDFGIVNPKIIAASNVECTKVIIRWRSRKHKHSILSWDAIELCYDSNMSKLFGVSKFL